MFDLVLRAGMINSLNSMCYKTKCNDGTIKMPSNSCSFVQNDTIYLNPCPDDYFCQTGFEVSKCIPKIHVSQSLAYPGEPCKKKTHKCRYGKCKYGYCQGQELNEPCSINTECAPGLYCNLGTCISLISAGNSGCVRDYDCENSAGCLDGTCVKYFSLKVGETVANCAMQNTFFCQSGCCWQNKCIDAIQSAGDLPIPCTNYTQCHSKLTSGMVFYSDCVCGYNKDGQGYCSLFAGDNYYSLYISSFSNWLSSEVSVLCNTERRFSTECVKKFWDKPNYQELMLYFYKTYWYMFIQNNDDCVEDVYTYLYWDLIDDITWGMYLVPGILIYLV